LPLEKGRVLKQLFLQIFAEKVTWEVGKGIADSFPLHFLLRLSKEPVIAFLVEQSSNAVMPCCRSWGWSVRWICF